MKISLAILALVGVFLSGHAQTQMNDSGIARTLQPLADTTIIVQYPSVWNDGPLLHLLSKKGDTINAYLYQRPKERKINNSVPNGISRAILLQDYSEYSTAPVNINSYFTISNANPDSLRKLWLDLAKMHLWQVKDDAVEGSGCPVNKDKSFSIQDGGGIYILLISRIDIKPLNFYAPNEFERFCPGRKGRQTAIKLSDMFYKAFR